MVGWRAGLVGAPGCWLEVAAATVATQKSLANSAVACLCWKSRLSEATPIGRSPRRLLLADDSRAVMVKTGLVPFTPS